MPLAVADMFSTASGHKGEQKVFQYLLATIPRGCQPNNFCRVDAWLLLGSNLHIPSVNKFQGDADASGIWGVRLQDSKSKINAGAAAGICQASRMNLCRTSKLSAPCEPSGRMLVIEKRQNENTFTAQTRPLRTTRNGFEEQGVVLKMHGSN